MGQAAGVAAHWALGSAAPSREVDVTACSHSSNPMGCTWEFTGEAGDAAQV
jgi:hypothetical protein